jgi:hypothetical protein
MIKAIATFAERDYPSLPFAVSMFTSWARPLSLQTRKMFAETRRMFVNARKAEQDVRKGGLVRTSEPNSCSYEAA